MAAVKTYQRTYDYYYYYFIFFYQLAVNVDASYSEYMISATLRLQEGKKKSIQPAQINIF